MTASQALASARSTVAPFHVMRVLAAAADRARTGRPVWDLTAGQPSTPAPAPVRDAARRFLDGHLLGYTPTAGIPELRQAIAGHYRDRYGLDVDPGQVFVTTGSSGGFLLAFLAAFDAGDRVGLARPGYPAYRNMLQALGCQVVELPCDADARYQPTVEQVAGAELAGLVLASPANPTGTMVTGAQLAALAAHCRDTGVRLVSDEIYHGITFAEPARSAWETAREGIVVNSFSKYFCMTGWRIGWLLLPTELVDAVDRLAGNLAICPPALAQYAAVHAFEAYDECDRHVARYGSQRDLLLDGLRALGVATTAPPDGAFYAYADVSGLTDDSAVLARELLDTVGLALAPGVDFDPVAGHRFVRLSFAGSAETIDGGLAALGRYLSAGG
ncbi:pyridoxal phosphate-dependent aminotransferase [Nakamurella endophytica]|uniref:Aminotransferase n=1 Tax=Nakamurella endophytica TaxID=1748367 RepID=A0A917T4E2_9ACTN|nr:pyridoxal phosphate-dependent aminotransferase [Nakamurella endophytica]GGM08754.1 aminotransferase [Nakamurella endophytica]